MADKVKKPSKHAQVLATLASFIEAKDLKPEQIQLLITHLIEHGMDITTANLQEIYDKFNAAVAAQEEEQKLLETQKRAKEMARQEEIKNLTVKIIDSWPSEVLKKNLADKEMNARIQELLRPEERD